MKKLIVRVEWIRKKNDLLVVIPNAHIDAPSPKPGEDDSWFDKATAYENSACREGSIDQDALFFRVVGPNSRLVKVADVRWRERRGK